MELEFNRDAHDTPEKMAKFLEKHHDQCVNIDPSAEDQAIQVSPNFLKFECPSRFVFSGPTNR